jgi:hypothetical protein
MCRYKTSIHRCQYKTSIHMCRYKTSIHMRRYKTSIHMRQYKTSINPYQCKNYINMCRYKTCVNIKHLYTRVDRVIQSNVIYINSSYVFAILREIQSVEHGYRNYLKNKFCNRYHTINVISKHASYQVQ